MNLWCNRARWLNDRSEYRQNCMSVGLCLCLWLQVRVYSRWAPGPPKDTHTTWMLMWGIIQWDKPWGADFLRIATGEWKILHLVLLSWKREAAAVNLQISLSIISEHYKMVSGRKSVCFPLKTFQHHVILSFLVLSTTGTRRINICSVYTFTLNAWSLNSWTMSLHERVNVPGCLLYYLCKWGGRHCQVKLQ